MMADDSPLFFVAGATGFTGRALVEFACRSGIETVAHIRPGSSSRARFEREFADLGADVDLTAWNDDAMAATMLDRRPTHVFALLGTTRKRARREGIEDAYQRVDYGLSALLMGASERVEPPPRFVYLSSMGVSEHARGAYLQARARMEAELANSTLSWTVARPSFIVGDRDEARAGERIGATLADGALGVFGLLGGKRLRDRYRSTDNHTLARALVSAALDPACAGQVIESDSLQARGAVDP